MKRQKSRLTGRQKQCEVFRHESGGLAIFFFFFYFEKIHRVRAVTKNKWPKSDEKTGFGGTLGLAPAWDTPPSKASLDPPVAEAVCGWPLPLAPGSLTWPIRTGGLLPACIAEEARGGVRRRTSDSHNISAGLGPGQEDAPSRPFPQTRFLEDWFVRVVSAAPALLVWHREQHVSVWHSWTTFLLVFSQISFVCYISLCLFLCK